MCSVRWKRQVLQAEASSTGQAEMSSKGRAEGSSTGWVPSVGSLGGFSLTDLGRTSSHFYVKHNTIEVFNELLKPVMNEKDLLATISKAQEFDQLKVRDEELSELDDLIHEYCEVPVAGGAENVYGKVTNTAT